MNLELAGEWESDVEAWNVSDRAVNLASPTSGYLLKLGDGQAHFRCESATAYAQALRHATSLVAALIKERREKPLATVECQLLVPSEGEFEELVAKLEKGLLAPGFSEEIGAEILDFAYLADVKIRGAWHQISIGPLRDYEIPARVAAKTLKKFPPVAVFCAITAKKPFEYRVGDLSGTVGQIVALGHTVVTRLLQ